MNFSNNIIKAIIHQSELDFITKWILEYPNLETGGDFFGYWTEEGIPVVEIVIGPGRNATRTSGSFYQDIDYLKTWGQLINGMAGNLKHIGAWHSHHRLSISHPSGGDVNTMRNALRDGNPSRFLISIGNIRTDSSVSINNFLFIKDLSHDYIPCIWEIKEGLSPLRQRLNSDPNFTSPSFSKEINETIPHLHEMLQRIHSEQQGENTEIRGPIKGAIEKPDLEKNSYWAKTEGKSFLKKTFENISRTKNVSSPEILLLEDKRIAISFDYVGRSLQIIFPHEYPSETPEVIIKQQPEGFRVFGNFFNANYKFEKQIQKLVYSLGIIKKNKLIVIQHLS